MLHNPARGPETSAYVGVKCHKMDEVNVLSHKDNVSAAPHDAEYLQNRPRNIRAVILHSDSILRVLLQQAFIGVTLHVGAHLHPWYLVDESTTNRRSLNTHWTPTSPSLSLISRGGSTETLDGQRASDYVRF